MKIKLTTLLFGLLLAVGWTSNASAQALPDGLLKTQKKFSTAMMAPKSNSDAAQMKAPKQEPTRETGVSSAVKTKSYYQQFKYNWTDDETGETHTNVDPTEPATNPYQIYELLRFVYGNPNFPGPTYSAYLPSGEREDPVTYNAVAGGWNITAGTGGATVNTQDITITVSNYYGSIASIKIYNAETNAELVNWDAATEVNNANYYSQTSNGNTYYYFNLPDGWSCSTSLGVYNLNSGTDDDPIWVCYLPGESEATITIPYSAFGGATTVRVVINACNDEGQTTTLTVNNGRVESLTSTLTDYTWDNITVAEMPEQGAFVQGTVVAPYEDGYTVLVVALNNDITIEPEPSPHLATQYTTKAELINYFKNNIEYVKLLSDALRIGNESDKTSGTVFNCDGRYNKFFFLGKGQARKKSPRIIERCANGGFRNNYNQWVTYESWYCESVPFEEMFEQFSPTSGEADSEITDFFERMREGNVYSVEHDCASVIQLGHQFSLSGNKGEDYYAFSGLNFFVPDYRLMHWTTSHTYNNSTYTVDGRDMNPYERTNTNGSHGTAFVNSNVNYSYWSAYYAQYNPTYAPKVGIYRITLAATATQVGNSHDPNNLNYNVTLTWVSSLNEMSGHDVAQTYTVYLVDENGNRTELHPESVTFYDVNGNELSEANPFSITQVVYKVPQNEHSYTIEYIVDGVANEGPGFHATSNRASVVIPGWEDFVGLKLDHHESDFDPDVDGERVNWYRNFLAMVNEDIYNGLTVSKIVGYNEEDPESPITPMNTFSLYRYDYAHPDAMTKVATITFDQVSAEQVHYTITYENQEIEPYTLKYTENNQTYTVNDAYTLQKLEVPTEGWVRVKGNGDIVIWPNRYSVNLKTITIKNGNTTVASWSANSANVGTQSAGLPNGWGVSPGSKLLPYVTATGNEKVCYMEGGGYLYIPGILSQYPNATVTIEAFGEAGNVNRISVNDKSQDITAVAGGTNYSWSSLDGNAKAPSKSNDGLLEFLKKSEAKNNGAENQTIINSNN